MRNVRTSGATGLAALVLAASACTPQPSPAPGGSAIVPDVGSVAILVVDDFDTTPPDPHPAGESDNCAYPTNTYGGRGGTLDPLPDGVSHGDVVFGELKELLTTGVPGLSVSKLTGDASTWPAVTAKPFVHGVESWTYGSAKVVLVGVDTEEYTVRKVTENIESTVDALRNAYQIQRFVLNLSFIIAPCDLESWMPPDVTAEDGAVVAAAYRNLVERDDLKDLKDELDAIVGPQVPPSQQQATTLWTSPTVARLRAALPNGVLIRLFYGRFKLVDFGKYMGGATEPVAVAFRRVAVEDAAFSDLFKKWQGLNPPPRVIPVGAAGNGFDFEPDLDLGGTNPGLRLEFPFAPAMWNSVVSVTSSPVQPGDGDRASYANSGEVALDGRWTHTKDGTDSPVTGTSFAAPRFSHLEALYLLRGGVVECAAALPATTPPVTHRPPVGYTNIDANNYNWMNKQLDAAIPTYCKDFWSYAKFPPSP